MSGNGSGLDCQYRLMSFRSTVYRRSPIITSLMTHSGKVRLFFLWVVCLPGCVRRPLPDCRFTSSPRELMLERNDVHIVGSSRGHSPYLSRLSGTNSSLGNGSESSSRSPTEWCYRPSLPPLCPHLSLSILLMG